MRTYWLWVNGSFTLQNVWKPAHAFQLKCVWYYCFPRSLLRVSIFHCRLEKEVWVIREWHNILVESKIWQKQSHSSGQCFPFNKVDIVDNSLWALHHFAKNRYNFCLHFYFLLFLKMQIVYKIKYSLIFFLFVTSSCPLPDVLHLEFVLPISTSFPLGSKSQFYGKS